MVGVPRSKGCRICVQRRVKCDQTRPTCNNCEKGNRPCPGYSQDLKFQDESQRLRKRYAQNGSSTPFGQSTSSSSESPVGFSETPTAVATPELEPKQNRSALVGDDPNHWDVIGLDLDKSQRRTFLGLLEGKSDQYVGMVDQVPQLKFELTASGFDRVSVNDRFTQIDFGRSLNPFLEHINSAELNQNQLIMQFRDSVAPNNGTVPEVFRNHAKWLAHLPPLTGTNPLLDASVRAVTLVHIGRLNNSEPFVNESRPYYGEALRLLNKALRDRKSGMSNETLCATILLSFYEMFASDNNDSWVRHAGGVSALMKARGPHRHRHGFDREIFLAYRYTLIVDAFQEDVPCFLAEPAWTKMSNEVHADLVAAGASAGLSPDRVEIFNLAEEYYQSMVVLPQLAANARALWLAKQSNSPPPMPRVKVLESLTQARALFKSTFLRFEAALKKAGHAPTIHLNHKDPLIGLDYVFVNTFVAATYTGYWTVLTVLNLCLSGLQSNDAEMVALYQTENRECALNICRSTAFMLTSSFLGPFFLIFGLRVALMVFEDAGGAECDWILRKLFEIGDRHMGIAKHVPGYRAGINVEDLIAESKARKEQVDKEKNQAFEAEFARQVAMGDIELPEIPYMSVESMHGFGTDIMGGSAGSNIAGLSTDQDWSQNTTQRIRDKAPAMTYTSRDGVVSTQKSNENNNYCANSPFRGMTDPKDVYEVWDNQENFGINFSIPPGSDSNPSSRDHSTTPLPSGLDQQTSDMYSSAGQGRYTPSQTHSFTASRGPSSPPNQHTQQQSQPSQNPQKPPLKRQGSGRPWELPDMMFSDVTANMNFNDQSMQEQQYQQQYQQQQQQQQQSGPKIGVGLQRFMQE